MQFVVFFFFFFTKLSAVPTAHCHASDRAGTGFARRASAGSEVTQALSHRIPNGGSFRQMHFQAPLSSLPPAQELSF